MPPLLFVVVILVVVLAVVWTRLRRQRRAEFIRRHPLPRGLYDALRKTHPQLSARDCQLVGQGLRAFFGACLNAGFQPVAMPSQAADTATARWLDGTHEHARA